MSKKIAMFGGSFNPIHKGHIKLAAACKEQAMLDTVLVIPTAVPPHKSDSEMISAEHRLNMCKLACADYPNLAVSDIEIKRQGKSYTKDTLKSLKEIYPDDELYLIVGADMFLTLLEWRNYEEIFSLATIIGCPRDESDYDDLFDHSLKLEQYGAKTIVLKKSVMLVSSTEIREKIKNNQDASDLLDANVYEYIKSNNLYR